MFCRTYGGHLASLASNKELSFVQKLCNESANIYEQFNESMFLVKCSKSTTRYMKIRLDIVRRKRITTVSFFKTVIVTFLKNCQDAEAYAKAEVLLEELRIISCYNLIEGFCDCISENLSLMLKKRECPEECREAVSSLIYSAAWVPDVPELKDLRAVFTHRFGNFIASSVNHEFHSS